MTDNNNIGDKGYQITEVSWGPRLDDEVVKNCDHDLAIRSIYGRQGALVLSGWCKKCSAGLKALSNADVVGVQ